MDNRRRSESGDRRQMPRRRPSPSALPATRTIPTAPRSPPCCRAPTRVSPSPIRPPATFSPSFPAAAGCAMLQPARLCRIRRPAHRQRAGDHALYRRSGGHRRQARASRISRPGGLSLTPPQMPVAQSPSALAQRRRRPSYLDFADWGRMTGGSFLATERAPEPDRWRGLPAAKANQARLTLARFYLANHFAAEALGLINLIQAQDPALAGRRPAHHHARRRRLHDGPLSRRP